MSCANSGSIGASGAEEKQFAWKICKLDAAQRWNSCAVGKGRAGHRADTSPCQRTLFKTVDCCIVLLVIINYGCGHIEIYYFVWGIAIAASGELVDEDRSAIPLPGGRARSWGWDCGRWSERLWLRLWAEKWPMKPFVIVAHSYRALHSLQSTGYGVIIRWNGVASMRV